MKKKKHLIGKDCEFYPCHENIEDCTFCFCPIYPCYIEKTGGKIIRNGDGTPTWDCSACTIIHKTSFVKPIKKIIKILIEKEVKGEQNDI